MAINQAQLRAFRREKDMLETTGFRQAKKISRTALVGAIKAYKAGFDPAQAVSAGLNQAAPLIVDAMVASELMGMHRGLRVSAEKLAEKKKAFGPYDWARGFVKDRLKLTDFELQQMRVKYGPVATNVTSQMSNVAERAAKKAMAEVVDRGMHIQEGMLHLRKALYKAGIEADQPWLLENMVRTQIHVAYGAGRWQATQDEEIQEILWGFEYVSIDDDRSRPTHAALNGTRFEKDDSRWSEIWPPNGFNCRCEVIEIFENVRVKEPPQDVEVGGEKIPVQPDAGWNINHGMIYGQSSMISTP